MVFITVLFMAFITDTSVEPELMTYILLPSGLIAKSDGTVPTGIVAV